MECRERLEQYLRENDVPFEILTHSQAYTMSEVAAALHVSGKHVAKVVIVKADGAMAMLVVPSPRRLNFSQVRAIIGAKDVKLAKEEEFSDLFPDCAPGAMPPFGNLYDVPVYADQSLEDQEEMIFRVGTHQEVCKILYADFDRLAEPIVGEFTYLS